MPPVPTPTPKATPKPKASPKPTASNKSAAVVKRANSLRAKYHKVSSEATSVVCQIKSGDSSWELANNAQNVGRLETLIASVARSMTTFDMQFVTTEQAQLRKEFHEEQLLTHIEGWLAREADVDRLDTMVRQLMDQRRTRLKYA